jgi:hypothetical protein
MLKHSKQSDQKFCPNLEKGAKIVTKPKNAKISTLKFNLKVQNIYIKLILNPRNTYNIWNFNTVINLHTQKVAQNVAISLGFFIFSENHNEPPKVAQMVKKCPIWSPCLLNYRQICPKTVILKH